MEKIETAAAAVVRQLDFTVLPDHPQAKLQSKLLALAKSQQLLERAGSRSPPQTAQQMKQPPWKMTAPPKSPRREFPRMGAQVNSPPMAPRSAHLVKTAPMTKPAQPLLKAESPKSRERCTLEQKDGTPKKQKQCNCKNSRCLKLYCECFASGTYCDGCNCLNCHNRAEHDAERNESIQVILERKPDAFRPKIANSPQGATDSGVEHNKGCNCKRSGCLKKYCECFQANILCSDKCKCMDCKNFEGSEERKSLFHGHTANLISFIQQATNAAIEPAESKKSGSQPTIFGFTSNYKSDRLVPQFCQESCLTSDATCSPLSAHTSKPATAATLLPSKPSYRSPLAGIIQLQDVKDFCTLLVKVSAEAAKSLPEDAMDSCGSQERSVKTSVYEQGSAIENESPPSPGTVALMCTEQDATIMTSHDLSLSTEHNARTTMNSEPSSGFDQLYVEQERLVLTQFGSFLNRLITRGCIEETKREQEAINDLCNKVTREA